MNASKPAPAFTLHAGTAAASGWIITATMHPDCDGCTRNAETAAAHASATGSRGATWAPERRNADGTVRERHSVTVERLERAGGAR